MTERETQIERSLVKMIHSHGGVCLKFTSPGNTGVPDRVCIVPEVGTFFVELKRPKGGRISEKQKYWRAKINQLGGKCFVIKNEEEIEGLNRIIAGWNE